VHARRALNLLPSLHLGAAAAASDRRAASSQRWAARQLATSVWERYGPRIAPFRHREFDG